MDLYCKTYGAGPALIVLHGLLGSSGNWHTLASKEFGKHFQVIAVDQRNHGRSPHDPLLDYPSMASDLEKLMDRLEIRSAHMLGHSMGGKAAMHFALTRPARVEKLVVVDIAPRAYDPHHDAILDALMSVDLSAVGSRSDADEALARRIESLPIRQFLLKNLVFDKAAQRWAWGMNLDAIVRHYPELMVEIESETPFDKPALFIRGERSNYVQDEDRAGIKRLFPLSTLVTLKGAGHWIHADVPEPFARTVLHFLRS